MSMSIKVQHAQKSVLMCGQLVHPTFNRQTIYETAVRNSELIFRGFVCLFVLMLCIPVNNVSAMSDVFLS